MSKKIRCKRLYRAATIGVDDINEEARTVEISFSSTAPVDRKFGTEILEHGADNVDLSQLTDGGAVLSDHNTNIQIGVVERAWLAVNQGRALIRFSRKDKAEEEFRDVIDGIRRNVSVGYSIQEMRETPRSNEVRVTRWKPLEISLVSVAADPTVGVGREAEEENDITVITEANIMTEETNTEQAETRAAEQQPAQPAQPVRAENPPVDAQQIRNEELGRITNIEKLGRHFSQVDLATKAINEGMPLEKFRMVLIDAIKDERSHQSTIGMDRKDIQRYSFLRAIASQAFPNDKRIQADSAYELELSQATAQASKQQARGIIIPYDMLQTRAPLAAGTATAAAELVGTDHLAGSFIEVLRNRMVAMSLGTTMLTGLVGNVGIPKQDSSADAVWIDPEGADSTEAAYTTATVSLTPRTVGANIPYTRQLLLQSDPSVELLTRNDLAAKLALAIDLAVFYGTGANGQPSGIATQVTQGTAFAAAVPTYGEIVDLESAVAVANADFGSMGYAVEPAMRGSFKQTEKFASTGMTIWEPGNTLNGYPAGVSSQITSGDVFFGNFSSGILGMWGGLDITVDPYSLSKSGSVLVVALQSVDYAIRWLEAFAWSNDGV